LWAKKEQLLMGKKKGGDSGAGDATEGSKAKHRKQEQKQ